MATVILLRLYFIQCLVKEIANSHSIRMLRPKYFLTNAECPLAKGLRFYIATLQIVEICQVAELFSECGMFRSTCFLNDSKRALPKHFGPIMVPLFIREPC